MSAYNGFSSVAEYRRQCRQNGYITESAPYVDCDGNEYMLLITHCPNQTTTSVSAWDLISNCNSDVVLSGVYGPSIGGDYVIQLKENGYIPVTTRTKGTRLTSFPDEYVVIDTETTGRDPKHDALIEVGALKYKNGELVSKYSALIKPYTYWCVDDSDTTDYGIENGKRVQWVDGFISGLTGITNTMLSSAKHEDAVIPEFLNFIGDLPLVGHNVHFDINFLYDASIRCQFKELSNDYVDTLRIARKIIGKKLQHHRLCDLAYYYGIDRGSAHRAIDDCKTTNLVFQHLKSDILAEYGDAHSFFSTFKRNSYSTKTKAKDIIADTDEIDDTNPIYGRVCVFTGTLDKMSRKEAMQMVANLGGINADSVTKKTNYLILGNLDYATSIKNGKSNKQKYAEKLKQSGNDIEIISEDVFYDIIAE